MSALHAAPTAPPLMDAHASTWALLSSSVLYRGDGAALFLDAMRELVAWHHQRNGLYRKVCAAAGFDPARDLDAPESVDRIPYLTADTLARWPLATDGAPQLRGVRAGRFFTDTESELRRFAMLSAVIEAEGLISARPVHHVLFARPPGRAERAGGERFYLSLCEFAPPGAVTYGLRETAGRTLAFDGQSVAEALRRASLTGEPVRLIGLPALIARIAQTFESWPVKLGMGSLVLTSGGWEGSSVSRSDFRALMARAFHIAPQRVLDLYRSDEHPATYLECSSHAFHAPVFARARVVDPVSLRPVIGREPGVLALMTPGSTATPSHALVTTDVARTVDCGCGRRSSAFEILGRGGKGQLAGFSTRLLEMISR